MKVNIQDFYPNANYPAYLKKGNVIDKPKNASLEVGMLMYDKPNNSIGMILGCIDEEVFGEVRLDSDGMQPIANLRLAKLSDFKIDNLRFKTNLDKMINSKRFKLEYNIGKVKYLISYHDGEKKHKDGSDFFDIALFKNKKKLKDFTNKLISEGYVEQ